jgi:eukaryotic-like serine/threonine-protein kinase
VNEQVLSGAFVLPEDVLLVSMVDVPDDVRVQVQHRADDYAISRPLARTPTSVISVATAALLESFRNPKSIVDAIMEYAQRESCDPQRTLEEAFPTLSAFVNTGLLLPATSELAKPIAASLKPGARALGYTIIQCAHVLVDTEVYCAKSADGTWVALKIARRGAADRMAAVFRREAEVLARLDGCFAPVLLEVDDVDGLPCLALTWCQGAALEQALASAAETGGRQRVLDLCEGVLKAYAALHERGVLHGDVHSGNVLVASDDSVTILDYGLACWVGPGQSSAANNRGGVDLFMTPECALARMLGAPEPPYCAASEQYAVAALVYLMVSGAHTHDFSLEEQPMLRQIARQPPCALADRCVAGLHEVEAVLLRALNKDPDARHDSVADMRAAFTAARTATPWRPPVAAAPVETTELIASVLAAAQPEAPLLTQGFEAPTSSLQNGAAGLAYALLRIAGVREDGALLGLADVWCSHAHDDLGTETALFNADLQIDVEHIGQHSVLHGAAGVHFVAALIAAARGDEVACSEAVRTFLSGLDPTDARLDVAFGRAGALLACAALLDVATSAEHAAVMSTGAVLAGGLWDKLRDLPPIGQEQVVSYTGAAHGWAGMLHALLRWTDVGGEALPDGFVGRLNELADLATPAGRGVVWPRATGVPCDDLAASWCNGAAGQVAVWTAAAERYAEPRYTRLAEHAGWTAYEGGPGLGDLCCGWAGRAYALIELHRRGAGSEWLRRAKTLCARAASSAAGRSIRRDSLLKGDIGIALLAVELERPDEACMPLLDWR